MPQVAPDGSFVREIGIAFSDPSGAAVPVSPANPLPITASALGVSGKTPVTGTFGATGQSSSFTPNAGRDFNVSISGGSAVVQAERSFDSGATWFVVVTDAMRTSLPQSFSLSEPEAGIQYRLNCTGYTSGTVTYRISQ